MVSSWLHVPNGGGGSRKKWFSHLSQWEISTPRSSYFPAKYISTHEKSIMPWWNDNIKLYETTMRLRMCNIGWSEREITCRLLWHLHVFIHGPCAFRCWINRSHTNSTFRLIILRPLSIFLASIDSIQFEIEGVDWSVHVLIRIVLSLSSRRPTNVVTSWDSDFCSIYTLIFLLTEISYCEIQENNHTFICVRNPPLGLMQ